MSQYQQQSPRSEFKNSQSSFNNRAKNNSIVLGQNKQKNESIKVCIRVRPLLQHELMCDEIVYYPDSPDPSLMVR